MHRRLGLLVLIALLVAACGGQPTTPTHTPAAIPTATAEPSDEPAAGGGTGGGTALAGMVPDALNGEPGTSNAAMESVMASPADAGGDIVYLYFAEGAAFTIVSHAGGTSSAASLVAELP